MREELKKTLLENLTNNRSISETNVPKEKLLSFTYMDTDEEKRKINEEQARIFQKIFFFKNGFKNQS